MPYLMAADSTLHWSRTRGSAGEITREEFEEATK